MAERATVTGAGSEPPTLLKAMSMSATVPEEAPSSARLSLDDPRMVVAMQILGCSVEDLTCGAPPPPQPRGMADPGKSPRKVVSVVPAARRQELWERKQQTLWREVEAEAKGKRVEKLLKQKFHETVEEPLGRPAGRCERLREKQEKRCFVLFHGMLEGDAKLNALKMRSQAEIQRAIDTEKEKLERIQACAERHEKLQKQVVKQRAEAHEKLVKAMQTRQELRAAQAIELEENLKRRRKAGRDLIAKLKKSFRRVEEYKAETFENWQRVKEEHEEKMRDVTLRREEQLHAEQEELVHEYLEKEARTQERLAEKREKEKECALKGEADYLEKLENSQRQIEAKQAKKEEEFMEALSDQAKARQRVEVQHEEIKAEAKKYWTDKVVPVLEKKRDEEEKFQERLRRKAKKSRKPPGHIPGPISPRKLKYLQEESQRRIELRTSMDELVQQNLRRLERGQEFNTDRLLTRIEENNARSDEIHERRMNRHLQREAIMKEALIEKARVNDELRTMKVLPNPPAESEEKEKESK